MEPLTAQEAQQAAALDGSPPRSIPLESAVNFRDIGGYAAGSWRTRWGVVFRADNLSSTTPADQMTIRALGIATVIDLRTASEVDEGRFPTEKIPVAFHHLPLLGEMPDPDRFKAAPGMLGVQYQEIAQDAATQIGQALRILASPRSSLPAVIHCAAGKDRTGVLVAILLELLGVDDDVIAADYAMSAPAMDAVRRSLVERYPERREIVESANELFSAKPSNITRLLGGLRDRYGSVASYAAGAGAGPEVVLGLRQRLLEPST